MHDSISDFLNRLKLANRAGKESFLFPASRLIAAIASALVKGGYAQSFGRKGKKGRFIEVVLSYKEKGVPKVSGVRRISRLSRRVYRGAREVRPVRHGFGMAVLTTPKGVISDTEARVSHVGGEALFEIW
ncbi:MAG: SSU ribosomal protein S8P [Parcubacteria group bacterium Greene0416_79]|nr:MAG: SSU ribosomal protein S8P [Parcubacteria group bacterium Greene0416_79]